jgi:hypothetical protein
MKRIRYDELVTRPASPDTQQVAENINPVAYGTDRVLRVLRIQNLGEQILPATYGNDRIQRVKQLLKCTS